MPTGPEIVPSAEEIADEVKREAERKRLRDLEVAQETSTPEELLARIEPEGREFYEITKRLSNALLLSIAISTKRQADVVPVPVADPTTSFDPKEFFERASPKDKPKRKKAKSKKRKVR